MVSSPTDLAHAATNDNTVEWQGLFADQGPLYMQPTEPASSTPVTLNMRVFKGDLTSANIKYWETGEQAFHWVPMVWVQHERTGVFDLWHETVPASGSRTLYWFQLNDGSAPAWLNAFGITSRAPSSRDFWIVPDFYTPTWATSAISYQIFPDRFSTGDPTNDRTCKASAPVAPRNGQCPAGSSLYGRLCADQHQPGRNCRSILQPAKKSSPVTWWVLPPKLLRISRVSWGARRCI
jgi:alpha-glucosidase